MATPSITTQTQNERAVDPVINPRPIQQNRRPGEYNFDILSGRNEEERTCSSIGQGIVELFVSNLCFVHSYAVNSWLFFFGSLCCFTEGMKHFGGGVYRVIKDLFCCRNRGA